MPARFTGGGRGSDQGDLSTLIPQWAPNSHSTTRAHLGTVDAACLGTRPFRTRLYPMPARAHFPRPAAKQLPVARHEAGLRTQTIGCELCFCHQLAEGPGARGCCASHASASSSVARGTTAPLRGTHRTRPRPGACLAHRGVRSPVSSPLSCRPSFMFRSVLREPSPTPSQRTPTAATPP